MKIKFGTKKHSFFFCSKVAGDVFAGFLFLQAAVVFVCRFVCLKRSQVAKQNLTK